jgi:cell division inhibitor SepF
MEVCYERACARTNVIELARSTGRAERGQAMSALRKAGVWLGLIEDDEADGGAAYDEDPAPSPQRERRYSRVDGSRPTERVNIRREAAAEPARPAVRSSDSTVSYLSARDSARDSFPTRDNLALAPEVKDPAPAESVDRRYHITTLHPTTYREARTIGEHFRQGTPVIMNLTEMEEADARRLVDFGAGLVFGLRGSMDRVTNRVFLLLPPNVHVTAEDKAKIAEGEFFRSR